MFSIHTKGLDRFRIGGNRHKMPGDCVFAQSRDNPVPGGMGIGHGFQRGKRLG